MSHLLGLLLCLGLLTPQRAHAHPLSPLAVGIEQTAPETYQVTFRRSEAFAEQLVLDLARSCRESARKVSREGDQRVDRFSVHCKGSIEGRVVRVLGLAELSLSALVHARFLDGRSVRALLTPEQPSFVVPRRSTRWEVFRDYLGLGVEHLLTGFDHVLFVLGLLLLVSGVRRLIATLTAFTLGHGVTLCASALSFVSVPQGPVEVGIALSLVMVALELVRSSERSQGGPKTWWLAGFFGLLHGLGFAGALRDMGLPEHEVFASLFAFNLGVELGQLLVVLVALSLVPLCARLFRAREHTLRTGFAYSIGALSAMWCIERAVALFA